MPFRFKLGEWTGAIGDMGSFVPVFIALVGLNHFSAKPILLLFGLAYVASSFFYRLPIPVQTLKLVSAVVIAKGLGAPYLAATGIWMGAILLFLALTGTMEKISRFFTQPVVKGIQLGVGLLLIVRGSELVFSALGHSAGPNAQAVLSGTSFNLHLFFLAFWILVLPQLPITLGNAIYATSTTARDYFGEKAENVTPKNLSLFLGFGNLAAGVFGGLPFCHGSDGLTAHYRFGARTGGATLIAGIFYILLAVFFGDRAARTFGLIPLWVFGIVLLYIGSYHAFLLTKLKGNLSLSLLMGFVTIATGSLFYPLLLGILAEILLQTELKNSFPGFLFKGRSFLRRRMAITEEWQEKTPAG